MMTIALGTDVPEDAAAHAAAHEAIATFAGGCFWCMEPPFAHIDGVIKVVPGYTGGKKDQPTYDEVCSGTTGHLEAVQVTFDPAKVSYEELLDVFWKNINPTDKGGQFADRGTQYGTAIFYHSVSQKNSAIASRRALEASGTFEEAIVTAILPARSFYPAEEYHREYYRKNPSHYKQYRDGSGRGPFLCRVWKDGAVNKAQEAETLQGNRPSDGELKRQLSKIQYNVAVCSATEPPFDNAYWNNHREGIYVDIISGEPLFSSRDKFDSGTGWPSFIRPIDRTSIVEREDGRHGMLRVEVRSRRGDTHLGHLFHDGPAPAGTRYCINSASLRFISREELERAGYGKWKELFE